MQPGQPLVADQLGRIPPRTPSRRDRQELETARSGSGGPVLAANTARQAVLAAPYRWIFLRCYANPMFVGLAVLSLVACGGAATQAPADSEELAVTEAAGAVPGALVLLAEGKGLACNEFAPGADSGRRWFCADAERDRQLDIRTPADDFERIEWALMVAIMPHNTDADAVNDMAAAYVGDFVSVIGGDEALAWVIANMDDTQPPGEPDAQTTIGGALYTVLASNDDPDGPARTVMINFAE